MKNTTKANENSKATPDYIEDMKKHAFLCHSNKDIKKAEEIFGEMQKKFPGHSRIPEIRKEMDEKFNFMIEKEKKNILFKKAFDCIVKIK